MSAPAFPLFDLRLQPRDLDAVERVLRSGDLRDESVVEAFERAFAEHLGVAHAVAVASCTSAIGLALDAAGVGPGDEVIVPSFTFAATSAAVLHRGASPVFADVIGPHAPTLDPADVARRLTERTTAMVVVHYAGYAAHVDELTRLTARHGVALIEDAAHAPLACAGPRSTARLGSHGLAGCFSFFSNKVLSAGEGGLIATDSGAVAARVRAGRRASASRLDAVRASLLLSRLPHLAADVSRRREITHRYRSALRESPSVGLPFDDEEVERSSCYIMPVLVDPADRDELRRRLLDLHGIQTSVLYPAVHRLQWYARHVASAGLSRTDAISRAQLTLPLHPHLSDADVDQIVSVLLDLV